jgi:hypothetical protein
MATERLEANAGYVRKPYCTAEMLELAFHAAQARYYKLRGIRLVCRDGNTVIYATPGADDAGSQEIAGNLRLSLSERLGFAVEAVPLAEYVTSRE